MGSNFMLGDGSFGAFTFYAREHQAEECNSHGLPLTPNTILMTGRFEGMRNIEHRNLCSYLDLLKCNGGQFCPSRFLFSLFPHRENGLCLWVLQRLLRDKNEAKVLVHSVSVLVPDEREGLLLFSFDSLGASQLAAELTDALFYLHERNMAASFLSTESVLFNKNVFLNSSQN